MTDKKEKKDQKAKQYTLNPDGTVTFWCHKRNTFLYNRTNIHPKDLEAYPEDERKEIEDHLANRDQINREYLANLAKKKK